MINAQCCDNRIPALCNSDSLMDEIKEVVEDDVPYIIAFDTKGKPNLFTTGTSKAMEINFPAEPIKTELIYDVENITLLRIKGSHKVICLHNGVSIEILLAAPHP